MAGKFEDLVPKKKKKLRSKKSRHNRFDDLIPPEDAMTMQFDRIDKQLRRMEKQQEKSRLKIVEALDRLATSLKDSQLVELSPIRESLERIEKLIAPRAPDPYDFTFQRDTSGFVKKIRATPVSKTKH